MISYIAIPEYPLSRQNTRMDPLLYVGTLTNYSQIQTNDDNQSCSSSQKCWLLQNPIQGDRGANRTFNLPSHFGAEGIFASKEAGFSWKSLPRRKNRHTFFSSFIAKKRKKLNVCACLAPPTIMLKQKQDPSRILSPSSLIPRPLPHFQCCTQRATLKMWEWPGDEATAPLRTAEFVAHKLALVFVQYHKEKLLRHSNGWRIIFPL